MVERLAQSTTASSCHRYTQGANSMKTSMEVWKATTAHFDGSAPLLLPLLHRHPFLLSLLCRQPDGAAAHFQINACLSCLAPATSGQVNGNWFWWQLFALADNSLPVAPLFSLHPSVSLIFGEATRMPRVL